MQSIELAADILTPDQAAAYLQVNRETVYRYIREGKLVASRLGRNYRVPRKSLELLMLATRTRPLAQPREFTEEQIARFREADVLDGPPLDAARAFESATSGRFFDEPADRTLDRAR
jgi:excisionase family DNA binding protein